MREIEKDILLTPADCAALEPRLCFELGKFLTFEGHAVYFPEPETNPVVVRDEAGRRLLLPLAPDGRHLATLLLTGTLDEEVDRLFPILPELVNLCLAKLRLEKALTLDPRAGLATERALYEYMGARAEEARSILADPGRAAQPLYKICLGMIVVDWPGYHTLARDYDYEFRDLIYKSIAARLRDLTPPEGVAAALGQHEGRCEFGVFFPAVGRGKCHILARKILDGLGEASFRDALTGREYRPILAAGHALYPQDMDGEELGWPVYEQALRLRDRARYASRVAFSLPGRAAAFSRILRREGRIIDAPPDGRARVNLGRAAGAREGMRFEIRDAAENVYKGQLVILSTAPLQSVAEYVSLDNATGSPRVGDKLLYMDSARPERSRKERVASPILGRGEFIAAFEEAAKDCRRFTLAVCAAASGNDGEGAKIIEEFLETNSFEPAPSLKGRSRDNAFIFFHPDLDPDEAKEFFRALTSYADDKGKDIACGLFGWPYLNFGRKESETAAFQALDYARLLPAPHIGVFDSVTLTISADRKFGLGDAFGAIGDYKLALLADPGNAMARNSLGVCLAGLGKLDEAKRLCETAMEDAADANLRAKIAYNLGVIYFKTNDHKGARKYFRHCLRLDPGHVYAGLRLGKMYESKGKLSLARKLYKKAGERAGADRELVNLAERHLASLDILRAGRKEGREILYNNLARDPTDAASMLLLAKTYLKDNEDPGLAELFARKSVLLTETRDAWLTLADALAALGKNEDAAKARERARKADLF